MRRIVVATCCVLLLVSVARAADAEAKLKLTGPHTFANLTIYLIHGPEAIDGDYLTLEEAMRTRKAIVYETGHMNQLAVENTSPRPLYIQSGEIVKGGTQDRSLANDLVVAPRSGKAPISAFCVEHDRSQEREGESARVFNSSTGAISGAAMKLAAHAVYKDGGGQDAVWAQIEEKQKRLSERLASDVTESASSLSFQLTLENRSVQAAAKKYIDKIWPATKKGDDVIGYAAVINGRLACADSYGSSKIFRKLWPKMLVSVTVDAASQFDARRPLAEMTPADIQSAFEKVVAGTKSNTQITPMVQVTWYETADAVLFETRDLKNSSAAVPGSYLHRCYIRKE